tara:strand:- start:83 stop:493 length:411 start_codon:yes stop_codon:yes gene_type:complete
MRVDSKEQFVRTMIENGYERISNDDNQLVYGLNPTYDDDGEASSSAFANYLQLDNGNAAVFLQFHLKNIIGGILDDTVYDKIFNIAKIRCDYDSLVENVFDDSDEMVQYRCNWNEEVRSIAFSKKDGTGYVYYIHF